MTKKELDYRTFDEWKKWNCSVKKGEKSHKRNKEGEALFSERQVSLNNPCTKIMYIEDDNDGVMGDW